MTTVDGLKRIAAETMPSRACRSIYSRNGLRERLSVVTERSGPGHLAINLFRHETQPGFSDEEIDRVTRVSPLLLACVERHIELHRQLQPGLDCSKGCRIGSASCASVLNGWAHTRASLRILGSQPAQ